MIALRKSIKKFGSLKKIKKVERNSNKTSNLDPHQNTDITDTPKFSINRQLDSKEIVDELEKTIKRWMNEGRKNDGSDTWTKCDSNNTLLSNHLLELCSLLKDKLAELSKQVEDYKKDIQIYKSVLDCRRAVSESVNCQGCEKMKHNMNSLKESNKNYQAEIASLKERLNSFVDYSHAITELDDILDNNELDFDDIDLEDIILEIEGINSEEEQKKMRNNAEDHQHSSVRQQSPIVKENPEAKDYSYKLPSFIDLNESHFDGIVLEDNLEVLDSYDSDEYEEEKEDEAAE